MADDHQRGAAPVELALQPFDGGQIEMIGRLVEQQDVGLRRQHARKRGAARFAAGEMRRVFCAGEAELLQQIAGGVADRRSAAGRPRHRPSVGGKAGKIRLLRQIAHDAPGCTNTEPRSGSTSPAAIFSSVDLPEPLRPTSETRSPVDTDSSAPVEQRRAAKGQCDVFELQKRRSHRPYASASAARIRAQLRMPLWKH